MMIKLKKKELGEILPVIADIVSKPSSSDIVSNVKIVAENNCLTVYSTNYDLSAVGKVFCEVQEPLSVCVNGKLFASAFREIQQDEIELEVKNNWFMATSGTSRIKMAGISGDLFPEVDMNVFDNSFTMSLSDWEKHLGFVSFAIGENLSRRNLTGMNLRHGSSEIIFTASDSYRMAMASYKQPEIPIPVESSEIKERSVIIPKKALLEMLKLPDDGTGKITLSYDDRNFMVKNDIFMVKTRLIDGTYPDLMKVLFKDAEYKIGVNAGELLKALRLSRIFGEDSTSYVIIKVEGSTMIIDNEAGLENKSTNSIQCRYDGSTLQIGLNIRYLSDALNIYGEREVEFLYKDIKKPLIIHCSDFPDLHNVVMPVNLSENG